MDIKLFTPDWLKYGILGLVAVFGILIYLLLKKQINLAKGKHLYFLISILILTLFLFLWIAGSYNYSEFKLKNSNKNTIDSLNNIIVDLKKKNDLYAGKNPEGDSLLLIIKKNKKLFDSLERISDRLIDSISQQDFLLNNMISERICPAIDDNFYSTSGKLGLVKVNGRNGNEYFDERIKKLSKSEINFRRLRLAVFSNIRILYADINVLNKALLLIQKRNPDITDQNIKDIIAIFPDLLRLRLTWIDHVLLPKSTQNLENHVIITKPIQSSELTVVNPTQITPPNDFIQYPKKVWIFDGDSANARNGIFLSFTERAELEIEKKIILKKL